jgi:phosphoglycerol transferase MdoB-like AlkP superfamily enzyme
MYQQMYSRAPLLFLIFSNFTRLSLALYNAWIGTISWLEIPAILGIGFLFDLRPVLLFTLCFALISKCTPSFIKNWIEKRPILEWFGFVIVLFLLSFQMFAEWIFWGDMDCRFNFIAIDYLIYTHEVVNNIMQSYPIKTYLAIMLAIAGLGGYYLKRFPKAPVAYDLKTTTKIACFLVFSFLLPIEHWSKNNFSQELSENGTSNLLHAFFNNQLNYNQFYQTIEPSYLKNRVERYLQVKQPEDKQDLVLRSIPSYAPLRNLNVVLITVESLSQEFLDKKPASWTPFISSLKSQSICFNDHYATGTRTVRGLEALALSVPPTPGSSILRRPHHENLYSVSSVLKPNGYEMLFWYGGYGYFDNMNAFFERNGFTVRDRLHIPSNRVEHETIWGVSDEHLFDAFLEEINTRKERSKPFFSLIMTTSNHRPYTFPKNRISMPQGTREAAVRYTDWAIEQFLEKAKKTDWFDNTLFVITADHCASSAGKMKLDPSKYLTPCLFYAPKHLEPRSIDIRTSQMDVIPSIIGLLGIGYESRFYGNDQVHTPIDRPVPLGTYQRLGFFGKEELVILSPKKEVNAYKNVPGGYQEISKEESITLKDAIGLYQSAFNRYKSGQMDANPPS